MHRSVLFALVLVSLVACSGETTSPNGNDNGDGPGPAQTGEPGGPGTGGGDHTGFDNAVGCPSVLADVSAQIPTIVFLVDRSGTMENDFGPMSRWDAVYQTLMQPDTGLIASYEERVRFGLATYSGQDNNPTCPIINEIAPAMGNFQAIESAYSPQDPIEDTPTAESLDVVAPQLAALDAQGPKAIIVATDGLPDTCADPDPDGQPMARAMAVDAARNAYSLGIETYIISVGDEVSDDHLQEMANAGVGLPDDSPEAAPYWRALDPISLEEALGGIVAGVQGCDFQLDGAVILGATGGVTLDGTELTRGSEWELMGNDTIRLLGAACNTIRDGGDHEVEAIFTCSGDQNGPGDGSGGYDDTDDSGPCYVDDDCEGDDVCNYGVCEAPVPGDGPVVQ